jgi:isoaspartyl peptidase/L-asparaginase-like protein (Ntn-hydrolase superfamily)
MTGVGERIMVLLSAKRLCDLVAAGRSLEEAARAVIDEVGARSSYAGVIAVGADGSLAEARNTPFMAAARRTG